jgi:hypothetical protein
VAPAAQVDLQAALVDHQRWADRLHRYGLGDRSHPLDADFVCQTDHCALGHWLRAHTNWAAAHATDLQQLTDEHAAFHLKAAVVITLVQTGAVESALQSVQYGDFARVSARLMLHLHALRDALASDSASGERGWN